MDTIQNGHLQNCMPLLGPFLHVKRMEHEPNPISNFVSGCPIT